MDLGVVQGSSNPLDVYCDNNGAIAQAKDPRQHQKNKHILMRYHLIRQFVVKVISSYARFTRMQML